MLKNLKKESAQDSMSHVPFAWADVDANKSDLTLEIDPLIFYKIMHWIDKENYEVSGLGMIEVDHERNVMRVVDAILLTQENTSATTEIDGQAIGRAMHEFRQRQSPGMLKWWWHSHVSMPVFWSGTDQAAIKCLGGGDLDNASWFVATVFNQRREMLTAYVQNRPIKLVQTGIETKVRQRLDASVVEQWDAEYDEKVELPSSSGSFLFSGDDDKESRYELFKQWRERQEEKIEEQLAEAEEVDDDDAEEEEVDLATAVAEGDLSVEDLFAMHDIGDITDDELDELYALHPGQDPSETDLVELMEQEDQAMDIGPVRKKSLRDFS
jgi:hypothetical protein